MYFFYIFLLICFVAGLMGNRIPSRWRFIGLTGLIFGLVVLYYYLYKL